MNEKLQYATMLEIPVNTANVTFKPKKFRRGAKKKMKNRICLNPVIVYIIKMN